MGFTFSESDIVKISEILGCEPSVSDAVWTWQMFNKEIKQPLIFSIQNEVDLGGGVPGALISAQTPIGYYELHDCNGYFVFEPDEIIFAFLTEKHLSSLIIGRQCTCSVFSNIRREILKAEIIDLDPAVLLAAMQLSIMEDNLV